MIQDRLSQHISTRPVSVIYSETSGVRGCLRYYLILLLLPIAWVLVSGIFFQ